MTTYHGIYSYNYKWNFTGPNTEWTGSYAPQVTSSTSHEAGFTIGAGSKIWIGATVTDKSGNESLMSNGFWSWTKANTPSITILNNNVWTKTKGVQIQGIANHKVMYTTDGSDPSTSGTKKQLGNGGETWVMGFDINSNCTIKAVYVNTTTNQVNSSIGQASTTKIDTTVPTIAELTLVSSSANQIKVNAKGADTESGVKYYRFEKSTTSATTGFTTDTSYQVNTGTREHTYNVNANTTYYLKVIVTDKAGNTKESNVITVRTRSSTPILNLPKSWVHTEWITIEFGELYQGEELVIEWEGNGYRGGDHYYTKNSVIYKSDGNIIRSATGDRPDMGDRGGFSGISVSNGVLRMCVYRIQKPTFKAYKRDINSRNYNK